MNNDHKGCTCPICCPEKWIVNAHLLKNTKLVKRLHEFRHPSGATVTVDEITDDPVGSVPLSAVEPAAEDSERSAKDTPSFVDTPVLKARRTAFDRPTIANLDALIQAVRQDQQPTCEHCFQPLTCNAKLVEENSGLQHAIDDAHSDRDSWRRVSERLESEKQAAESSLRAAQQEIQRLNEKQVVFIEHVKPRP